MYIYNTYMYIYIYIEREREIIHTHSCMWLLARYECTLVCYSRNNLPWKGFTSSSFFRPRKWKIGVLRSSGSEDRRWVVVLRSQKIEAHPHLRRTPPSTKKSTATPSSVRPSDRSSGPKIEDGEFFDLRGRRSKIEDGIMFLYSASKIEDGGILRYSKPKIEDEGFFEDGGFFEDKESYSKNISPSSKNLPLSFESVPPSSKNPVYSIFDFEQRRTPYLRSSKSKIGSQGRRSVVVSLINRG